MAAVRKVLVVDDDPVVGKSFDRVLSRKGYAVITAEDGYEAMAKLQAETYDLVFTDLRMPGMSGLDLAQMIKTSQPWMPVVVVTGYGSKRSQERARVAGVSEFLHKPLSPEIIEESTERALHPAAAPAPVAEAEAQVAAAAPQAAPETAAKPNLLKNMALFLVAPFVGLVYAVFLPFVGLGMLAWFGAKAIRSPRAE